MGDNSDSMYCFSAVAGLAQRQNLESRHRCLLRKLQECPKCSPLTWRIAMQSLLPVHTAAVTGSEEHGARTSASEVQPQLGSHHRPSCGKLRPDPRFHGFGSEATVIRRATSAQTPSAKLGAFSFTEKEV